MNMRDFLLPLTLALLTTWAVQYFIFNRGANSPEGTVQSGQTFVAPQNQVETRPLNREVDFIDTDATHAGQAQATEIQTDHAIYTFSTNGASLQQLTFKRVADGKPILINTVEAYDKITREEVSFLVALNEKTPYYYTLVSQQKLASATQLIYKAETDVATIQKTFTVHDDKYQIDLELTITPKREPVQARLMFGSPFMSQVKDDQLSAVYNTQKGSLEKETRSKIDLNKGWFAPTFFGTEDRYFVHALVSDQNKFTQRAYYALRDQQVISIMESGLIEQPTTWNLSFFVGPKDEKAMAPVDPRLEQLLDYSGILAPLARVLLMVLNYLYNFLHNYGWAIVVMTILINLLLLPLNLKSAQGMKKYNEFQKKLEYIKRKYKDDPDTLSREQAALITKNGMPGLGGCLPKLLQLPIFFALSRVLSNSIQLYQAPFLWIKDLSSKDPYYILPIAIVISMIIQSTATDPKQRFTMMAVALVFGAVAANFSAGLSLYILVGIILMNIQTYVQQKFNWA